MTEINTFSEAVTKINTILHSPPIANGQMGDAIKRSIQGGYNFLAHNIYNKTFLNWGMWDKNLYKEYCALDYNFGALCPYQDLHSQLLLYYLLKPLIEQNFRNKQIIEVGCGNGIGLKMASQLLQADYALGIDLTHSLAHNAFTNFREENKNTYVQGDAEHLPLADKSVDLITNIESSHLYPHIELFFSEVARILKPKGFFCYTDVHITSKQQAQRLERFLETRSDLRIVLKRDITKNVQAAIYRRLIIREQNFNELCVSLFGEDPDVLSKEAAILARSMGINFLPWWKIWVKTPLMRPIAKAARNATYWDKKHYFHYLIQKI